jgi:hypothetical protein
MPQQRAKATMIGALAAAALLLFGIGTYWTCDNAREQEDAERQAATEKLQEEDAFRMRQQKERELAQIDERTSFSKWLKSGGNIPIRMGKESSIVLRLRGLPKRRAHEESSDPKGTASRAGD